ncbi:MAG TPA: 2,3-diaminopropionate biosynthesis protein SbnA [Thermoanaerobaculia bacterium]|nr:2,3-diaminopropionate biosynthesis protein SbnA [Thermoanaerobaculia bacterium]
MREGVLAVIGDTPLLRLKRAIPNARFTLFAKLESLNPGGSIKDRPAIGILSYALRCGELDAATVVIESSSGNMGIGLAQACTVLGLRFICVVDPKITKQNLLLLAVYGAEIVMVSEPDANGEFLPARLQRVQSLLAEIPGSFWPNQYANAMNTLTHYQTTMHEIAEALQGKIDFLFCATSTCGTVMGCAEYVRDHRMHTKVIAVDAVGSVIFGHEKGPRLLPGMGAGVRPALCRPELVTRSVVVSDLDCVIGCRRLVRREGLLAGGSSGGVLMAIEHMQPEIPPGSVCVGIFPDRGERYLDTVFSDAWVCENLGDISALKELPNAFELPTVPRPPQGPVATPGSG